MQENTALDQPDILYSLNEGVAFITLNRPAQFNAITPEMNLLLREALRKAADDPQVDVLVLTGAGKAFCAGGDLRALSGLKPPHESKDFIRQSGETAAFLYHLQKPVIAMVNGVAAGAGFNLMLLCDLAVCADTARFSQSFVKVGLVADWGGNYLLQSAIGLRKAKELHYLGGMVDASEALRLNLVNRVVPEEQLFKAVMDLARGLQALPLDAIQASKALLHRASQSSLEETLNLETRQQGILLQSPDFLEGSQAFLGKRTAVFNHLKRNKKGS